MILATHCANITLLTQIYILYMQTLTMAHNKKLYDVKNSNKLPNIGEIYTCTHTHRDRKRAQNRVFG